MNNEFNEFLRKVVTLEPREKVNLAQNSLAQLIEGLKAAGHNDEEITAAIFNLAKLFIASDRRFTEAEYLFFRAVTGLDVDAKALYEFTGGGASEEFRQASLEFFKGLDKESRGAAFMFGVSILSCDNNIDFNEIDLIGEILSIPDEA